MTQTAKRKEYIKKYNKEYFGKMPKTKRAEYARAYYLRNADKIKVRTKSYYEKNRSARKIIVRKAHLKTKYGITLEYYNSLCTKQKNSCAICKKPSVKVSLAVDHNHKTGAVRGLLCSNCNRGLGHFQDDKKLLLKAIKYQEKYESK